MDELVGDSPVILGGPAGDSEQTLHVVETADENEVRARAAGYPQRRRTPLDRHHWALGALARQSSD